MHTLSMTCQYKMRMVIFPVRKLYLSFTVKEKYGWSHYHKPFGLALRLMQTAYYLLETQVSILTE